MGDSRSWYKIRNLSGGVTEMSIYDEIGTFGVTARDFINDLAQAEGPVSLRISSPGGEVFDGLAIYSALKARKAPVSVTVDALAASIASVIAQAASPGQLSISPRASFMIHDGFSAATGNAQEFRALADVLERQSDNIAAIYADRTGKPAEFWRDQMKAETWFVGQQAVDAGLADSVAESGAPADQFDMSKVRNASDGASDGGQPKKTRKRAKSSGSQLAGGALLASLFTESLKGGDK